MNGRVVLAALAFALACAGDRNHSSGSGASSSGEASTGSPTTGAAASTGAPTTGGPTTGTPTTGPAGTSGGEQGVAGIELAQRLAGLWSGPATMTPLGSFPLMNMDFRAASGHVLFGRVDLDAANNLRFAFEVEDHGAGPVLVYRNGGYFLGILRDSRAVLVEHTGSMWRFCSTSAQGCDYIDARFSFDADDHVILDVDVKGMQHVYWDATRKETRALPQPFPVDLEPQAADAPFPTMPSLRVTVTWKEPLAQDGETWVIVTTQPCDVQFTCTHSRSLRAAAAAGATSATLLIEQIHAGDYQLTAVLDRNGNMAQTMFPDAGDGVSLPNKAVEVAPAGETSTSAAIVIDL